MLADPRWIFPAIHDGSHADGFRFQGVVDGEWKALGQGAMEVFVSLAMDASVNPEGIDV
jgi:hypothetical protein